MSAHSRELPSTLTQIQQWSQGSRKKLVKMLMLKFRLQLHQAQTSCQVKELLEQMLADGPPTDPDHHQQQEVAKHSSSFTHTLIPSYPHTSKTNLRQPGNSWASPTTGMPRCTEAFTLHLSTSWRRLE